MTISAKSATDLKPMSDRVVVRPATEDEMTVGGIILPDTARQRPQKGEVVAVGPGPGAEQRRTGGSRGLPRRHGHLLQVRRHGDPGRRRGASGAGQQRHPGQDRVAAD